MLHDTSDTGPVTDSYASDRAPNSISTRFEDQEGRLFVGPSVITKVGVSSYQGRELANWQALGLEPDRIYRLFRAPEELEKAAPLLRGQPLLSEHASVSADNHKSDLTIGSVGTDTNFDGQALRASLGVWRQPYVSRVKDGTQREISMGYRFRPDMTPGDWNGESYDGVMRNIRPNHVALVPAGRVNLEGAGPMAEVADSAEGIAKLSEKNTDDDKMVAAAGDEGAADQKGTPKPNDAAASDEKPEGDEKKPEKKEGEACDEGEKPEMKACDEGEKKEAGAMDAASITAKITADLRAQFRDAAVAREEVRPVVGAVSMAMDSAEDIYGAALKQKGVDIKGVHPSAFPAMFKALRASWDSKPSAMAMDSVNRAKQKSAEQRLGADRIRSH